jgi:predicted TIM-barrel fold metal-dependent hydrolase
MIIDYHVHCDLKIYENWEKVSYAVMCKNVENIQKSGVDAICVSGGNDTVAKLVKDFPGYVTGFIYIRLGFDEPEIIDRYRDRGFKGVKFIYSKRDYDDERNWEVYEKIEKNGMPTLFHTAIVAGSGENWQIKDRVSSNYMKPINLDKVARCFPKMTVVGAHLGYPWYEEAMGMMAWHPNVYFDLCIGQLSYLKGKKYAIMERIKNAYDEGNFNADKLLYGSDCFLDMPEKKFISRNKWSLMIIKTEMGLLKMTAEEKKKIMYKTAEKVLKRF